MAFLAAGTRREFLRGTTVAALAGAIPQPVQDPAQSVLERRHASGLKLSCSCLPFSDMKWDDALAQVKKLGFRYVELAMYEGGPHVSPSALSDPEVHGKKIAAVCARLELDPIAIHAHFVLGDPRLFPGLTTTDAAARKTILAQFERVVTCARTAEIPLVSVLPGRFVESVPADVSLKNACDMFTQMHALVARRGLLLAFENQTGSIGQLPADAVTILEQVPGLRLHYQLGHVVANQYSVEQTQLLLKHVAHVGVRNARPGHHSVPLENGELSYPVRPYLDALRAKHVNAYVSVAYLRTGDRAGISPLKAILEQQGISVS